MIIGTAEFYYENGNKIIGTADVVKIELLSDHKLSAVATFTTYQWRKKGRSSKSLVDLLVSTSFRVIYRPKDAHHVIPLCQVRLTHIGEEIEGPQRTICTYGGLVGHDFRNGLERAKEKACQTMQSQKTTTESK